MDATMNGFIMIKLKLLTLLIINLLAFKSFSQLEVDKKCRIIYSNYLEKDSLLAVSTAANDSLVKVNKDLQIIINKLQGQIDEFERDAKLIKIGKQEWDAQNLRVNKLNDGTPIILAQSRQDWDSLFNKKVPAYCLHKSDSTSDFGYMYNYYALESGKLAPKGFKIPDRFDIELLKQFLQGVSKNGAALLKASNSADSTLLNWDTPGSDAFGLEIRPFGFRVNNTTEWYINDKIYFWCQTDIKEKMSILVLSELNEMPFLLEKNVNDANTNYGLFVRCIHE